MQTQFKNCATGLGYQFEDTRNTFRGKEYVQESVCILFSKTVKECGKVWKKCHTDNEVQHLQDMHLESLLTQYKDIQLDHCSIVKEYMQSGRRKEINQQVEKCDEGSTATAQEKFQSCSHSSSTLAYQKIMDVQEENLITDILCDTLRNIASVCSKDLEKCFSNEDLVMMTTSHLKEMKKFLVRITRGKVEKEALEACDGVSNHLDMNKHTLVSTIEPLKLERQKQEQKLENTIAAKEIKNPDVQNINNELLNIERKLTNNDEQKNEMEHAKSETLLHKSAAEYKIESINSSNKANFFRTFYLVMCLAHLYNYVF